MSGEHSSFPETWFVDLEKGSFSTTSKSKPALKAEGGSTCIHGSSEQGEGVHGETKSDTLAAVAGIQLNENPREFPAGVYGKSRGKGGAIVGISKKNGAGIRLSNMVDGVITGNRCYDSQTTKTQTTGILEVGTANFNAIVGNNARGNLTASITTVGANTITTANIT